MYEGFYTCVFMLSLNCFKIVEGILSSTYNMNLNILLTCDKSLKKIKIPID